MVLFWGLILVAVVLLARAFYQSPGRGGAVKTDFTPLNSADFGR
jgi:hypothetical protein